MATDTFESSDSIRSARPLKHLQNICFPGPFKLELGEELQDITVAFETYGILNDAKDNAVLVCHALSGDSHIARHDPDDDPGWWDIVVGPGMAIDTERYFVICANALGGCRGTTGPNSRNPLTGKRYGAEFPTIVTEDIVETQKMLVDHLGIDRLLVVVGGSMGGQQALSWAIKYPDRVGGTVALATSARLTTQALAFDVVGRNAIYRDPGFKGGQYLDENTTPAAGLAIARMLGHITYLSPEAMRRKFGADRLQPREFATEFEKKFSVGSYLAYQGDKFVERFDANSYVKLSMAMDLFDLGGTGEELYANLNAAQCRWLIISFTSDWLFPPMQSQELTDALIALNKPVSYCNIVSSCGHDAFLLPDDLHLYGGLISAFLDNLHKDTPETAADDDLYVHSPASIFDALRNPRIDYDQIAQLIEPSSSVLDLGCGRGSLLVRLRAENRKLTGLEINQEDVLYCLRRGLDVIQADLNTGLSSFSDKQFDYIVLSHTLQAVRDVELLINDMLRVGKHSIVSFPNFAYHKLRKMLCEKGKSPVSSGLLPHKWYNTPNIRFFSIADFEEFCHDHRITIHQRIAIDTEDHSVIAENANLHADMAIFVISR
ncbi:MAG TPA: homoserine O-acetyltransferase [Acidobacteriota bacterium]|nr:homoserine O-acetyltransferase [Acidobacteriota bacterium]